MKTYALCLWMLLSLPSFVGAQNKLIVPVPIPTLAKKSPSEIENLLGKPHKRIKLREKVKIMTYEEDEIMSYKTAAGTLGIHFLQESVIAFSHSYKMNKQPADYEAALLQFGIDVNQQRPGTFSLDTLPIGRLPDLLKLADHVAARWRGDYGGVRWERVELHAIVARYELVSGKKQKSNIHRFLAVVGGPRLIWR